MNKTTTLSHTPGPWRVAPDDVTIHCGDENDPEIVAAVDVADPMAVPVSMQEANARLIAAAPELLEACKEALPQVERYRCTDPNGETCENPVVAMLRTAIAKAKGQL